MSLTSAEKFQKLGTALYIDGNGFKPLLQGDIYALGLTLVASIYELHIGQKDFHKGVLFIERLQDLFTKMLDSHAERRQNINFVLNSLLEFIREQDNQLINTYLNIEKFYYDTLTQESNPVELQFQEQF